MKGQSRLILSILIFIFQYQLGYSQFLLGVGAVYGDDIQEPGMNVRATYFTHERICFGPEFTIFQSHQVQKDGEDIELNLWEVNFNGHYVFELTHHLGIFPLVGLNISREREEIESPDESLVLRETAWGVNLGFGAHYGVGRFLFFAEYDYLFSDLSQSSFIGGVAFIIDPKKFKEKGEGHRLHKK